MELDPAQLERMIREVVARLGETPVGMGSDQTGATRSHTLSCMDTPTANTPTANKDTATKHSATTEDATTLRLTDKLVTAETLRGRFDDHVRRVIVDPKAVVTPTVRDLLRARKVPLVLAAESPTTTASRTGRVGFYVEGRESQWLGQMLLKASDKLLAYSDMDMLLTDLNRPHSPPPALSPAISGAIVVSERWAFWTCHANRNPEICAVAVRSLKDLDEMFAQVDPNLIVLDAKRSGVYVCRQVVAQLLDRWQDR
jgi:hypothetical protein